MDGGLESHTGRWMGKLAAERRDLEAVATSNSFVMGREARRVLEFVDVLGDARIFFPPGLHVNEDGDDVRSFETCGGSCEMVQHVLQRHLVVEGGGTLEGKEPGVFDDGGEEDAAEALGGADETLSCGGGCPFVLRFYAQGVGGVGSNGGVVGGHGEEERVEGVAVVGLIFGGVVDETGEAVRASWEVDGLEEVGERFAETLDIIVGRLTDDGGVGGREVTKEVLDIIRCGHDAQRKGEIYVVISWWFV